MKKSVKTISMWLIIGIILVILISSILDNKDNKMTYSELLSNIQEGSISKIELEVDSGLFATETTGKAYITTKSNSKVQKQVYIPNVQNFLTSINEYLMSK